MNMLRVCSLAALLALLTGVTAVCEASPPPSEPAPLPTNPNNTDRFNPDTHRTGGDPAQLLPNYRRISPDTGADTLMAATSKGDTLSEYYRLEPNKPVTFSFMVESNASKMAVATWCPRASQAGAMTYRLTTRVDAGKVHKVTQKCRRSRVLYTNDGEIPVGEPRGFDVLIPAGKHTITVQLEEGGPEYVVAMFSAPLYSDQKMLPSEQKTQTGESK
jgi:hypothetical protein